MSGPSTEFFIGCSTTRFTIEFIIVHTGSAIAITDAGAGGPGGVGKSALPCFAANLDPAVWLFPNMTVVTMETPPPTPNAIISFKQTFASYTAVIVNIYYLVK